MMATNIFQGLLYQIVLGRAGNLRGRWGTGFLRAYAFDHQFGV